MRITDAAKRGTDVVLGGSLLVVSLPLQGLTWLVVRLSLGRPALFRQLRAGRSGRPFTLVKFRTMRHADPAAGFLTDDERLTRLGRLLRATSLDELPSVWNVLRGDMSLVGPRPLPVHYLSRYTPEQARRHEVRPGLTGLAQVSGRNGLTWEERLRLDVAYVDGHSMVGDLWILCRTVIAVLRRDGISAEGHATMPEFLGTTKEAP